MMTGQYNGVMMQCVIVAEHEPGDHQNARKMDDQECAQLIDAFVDFCKKRRLVVIGEIGPFVGH